MRSFHLFSTLTRPKSCLCAATTVWVISLFANGPSMFAEQKVIASIVMGLGVLASSVYHFGAAHPMYARKSEVTTSVNPRLLIVAGIATFGLAILLAVRFLPPPAVAVIVFDTVVILFYARVFSRVWITKNSLIALVAASPVILGWCVGSHRHPAIPYGIGIVIASQMAREIVKDVEDRFVNNGFRLTLPLWLGPQTARRIAGAFMVVALAVLVLFSEVIRGMPWYVGGLYLTSAIPFAFAAYSLLFANTDVQLDQNRIMNGSWLLIATYFALYLSIR